MGQVGIAIVFAIFVTLALIGCEPANNPSGVPGSANFYVHGRTEVGGGVFWH